MQRKLAKTCKKFVEYVAQWNLILEPSWYIYHWQYMAWYFNRLYNYTLLPVWTINQSGYCIMSLYWPPRTTLGHAVTSRLTGMCLHLLYWGSKRTLLWDFHKIFNILWHVQVFWIQFLSVVSHDVLNILSLDIWHT